MSQGQGHSVLVMKQIFSYQTFIVMVWTRPKLEINENSNINRDRLAPQCWIIHGNCRLFMGSYNCCSAHPRRDILALIIKQPWLK